MKNLTSKKSLERQLATAMWVIDKLALRVGNEKGEDEADTVGCCSLRVEHISLVAPSSIQFDFLGKDSMRYFNTVCGCVWLGEGRRELGTIDERWLGC
jgi:DNA topoisomerase I